MSGSTSSKVMVVDPRASGRKSLTLMLERCGMEVFNLLPSLLNIFLIVSPDMMNISGGELCFA